MMQVQPMRGIELFERCSSRAHIATLGTSRASSALEAKRASFMRAST